MDAVIFDEVGCLPVSANGGALLLHLISKLHEKTSLIIATNLSFSEWVKVFGDAKMTTELLDRIRYRWFLDMDLEEAAFDSLELREEPCAADRARHRQELLRRVIEQATP